MKEIALNVFRRPPERLNCAQAVLHAWREATGNRELELAALKGMGGGRAPDGLCGALHAACLLAPDRAEALKREFAARLGSTFCAELRGAGAHPCERCVGQAAGLLEGRE